jgi:colicin import membrane protein
VALKIRFNPSEPGFWVSGLAHAGLLAAAVFTLTAPRFPDAQEGIPVEVITDNQFSEITKGETTAKQVQTDPKPRADRVADTIQQREAGADKRDAPAPPKRPLEMKVADKDEEVPAEAPAPPPRPEPKPEPMREEAGKVAERAAAEALARQKAESAKAAAQAKEAAEAEAKAVAEAEAQAKARAEAEAQAQAEVRRAAEAKLNAEAEARRAEAEAEARRTAELKAKAAAEARKAAEAKAKADAEAKRVAEAKAAEAKARKEAEVAKKLDVGDLRQFLNSKDKHQSTGATGAEIQKTASLGTAAGTAAKLNPSMRDALGAIIKEQMERCYSAPVGASGNVTLPILDVRFNSDGSLAAEPRVIRAGSTPIDRTVAETAARAVRRCAPYNIPSKFAPFYQDWKTWHIEFDLGQT